MLTGIALSLSLAASPDAVAQEKASNPAKAIEDGRVATEVFAIRPFMQNPRISPDGTKLAVKLGYKGTDYLAVIDLTKRDAAPEIVVRTDNYEQFGDRRVFGWRWVGNRTIVVTAAAGDYIFGNEAEIGRLFAYDLENKKFFPLAWKDVIGQATNILYVDHDNEKILLERQSGEYSFEKIATPQVVEVNVRNGNYIVVQKPNPLVGSWAADGAGRIRMGIGYDRDTGKTRVLYRPTEGGNFKTIYDKADPSFSGDAIIPEIFLPGDKAIVTSNKDGYSKVYELDIKTMKLGEPIFEAKGYDVGGVLCNKDCNALSGVYVTEKASHVYWLDPRLNDAQKMFEEQFGKGNARIVSIDEQNREVVLAVGKTNQTGSFYLYDTQTGDVRQIGWVNDVLKGAELNPTHTVTYTASDGAKIDAVITMPRHRLGQKNLPVVMITHGGPFGPRDEEGFGAFAWHQAVAEMGYVVVQPNYRGSGGYGREWIKKGRDDGFGMRMQDDLNDAIDYLASQHVVNPKRACMMGWSYGGYASARAAQRDPDRWQCAIAGAGVYDLAAMRKYDKQYLGRFGANYLTKGEADLASVSPAQNTDGRWSPILIVQGERDERVPPSQAKQLVSALKKSGKKEGIDFKLLMQPNNTHNFPSSADEAEFLVAAEAWLNKYNPAYLSADPDTPVPVTVGTPD